MPWLAPVPGFLLTFAAVVVAMVLFRSPTLETAVAVLSGMVAANGTGAPQGLMSVAWLTGLLGIALLLPNSLEIMGRYEPALGIDDRRRSDASLWRWFRWSPSFSWAVAIGIVLVIVVMRLGPESEFLYWQF
jgi:hypothetical protein